MMDDQTDQFRFSEARSLISDLGQPKPWIYWIDFTLSILGGHACFLLAAAIWYWQAPQACTWIATLMVPATIFYMRATMFIHELAHLGDRVRGFGFFWNLLCGGPLLVPTFLYLPHMDHHRRASYGTQTDGEYLSLSHTHRLWIIGFVAQNLVIPFLLYFRFLIISPICWLIPPARRWVHRHASTMLVDPTYERGPASAEVLRLVVIQEAWCFTFLLGFTFWHFFIPPENLIPGSQYVTGQFNPLWILGYIVAVCILTLNSVRTLGAHRWEGDGSALSFQEQLLDSVNYPYRSFVTELWGPIGTRFHALHHLFPSLPYHDLPEAHRRLASKLPADSPYHQTTRTSLLAEVIALWRRASA